MTNGTTRTTESGGGVIWDGERLVVVLQKGTSWSLPKGHLEDGETHEVAARREIREETGLDDLELVRELVRYERYKIAKDPAKDDEGELKRICVFLFQTETQPLSPEDPAITEARWVAPAEAIALLTHPKDREFLRGVIEELTADG